MLSECTGVWAHSAAWWRTMRGALLLFIFSNIFVGSSQSAIHTSSWCAPAVHPSAKCTLYFYHTAWKLGSMPYAHTRQFFSYTLFLSFSKIADRDSDSIFYLTKHKTLFHHFTSAHACSFTSPVTVRATWWWRLQQMEYEKNLAQEREQEIAQVRYLLLRDRGLAWHINFCQWGSDAAISILSS